MADFATPNFGNALVRGMQLRGMADEMQTRQRRRDLAPDVQAAIGGDNQALGRVAAVDPDYALKIGPVLDRLDANKRAIVKQAADFTVQAGMGLANTPPELRSQAYQEARAEAQRRGIPTDTWPDEWGPRAEGFMTFNVGKARDVNKYLDHKDKMEQETANQPVPMPGYGGPSPGGGAPAPSNDPMGRYQGAIAATESAGQPNGGYGALGPVANAKGNRAYGKYQVMDFNVGPWTQEVLGRAMTPQEFLANPQAQDAVFNAKFNQYRQKYGDEGAAKAWFAGEGGMSNPDAADVNGMTVARYGERFNRNLAPQVAQAGGPPVIPQGGGDMVTPGLPGGEPQAAQPDPRNLRSLLPPGVVPLMNPKTRMPVYDSSGRLAVQLPDGSRDFVEVPKAKAPGQATGPFTGNSVEGQALNMLIANGTLTQHQAAELAAGKTITNPADGSVWFMTPSGVFRGPPGQQQPGPVGGTSQTVTATPPGAPSAGPAAGIQLTPAKKSEAFKKLETEVGAVNSAIDNFQKIITEAGGGTINAYLNNPSDPQAQKILGAFNAMKTALRSEAFVNTGVLQPAEMTMLDNMLLSPQTVRGYLATPEGYKAMLDQIKQFVANKMDSARSAYGQEGAQPQGNSGQPKVSGPAEEGRTLFEARDAIRKGADPNAVKKRLQEMGVDPGKL